MASTSNVVKKTLIFPDFLELGDLPTVSAPIFFYGSFSPNLLPLPPEACRQCTDIFRGASVQNYCMYCIYCIC